MAELSYYIDDLTDEVMPCEPTLEGWAAFLAAPDEEWNLEPAIDGATFKTSVMRFDDDVIATRTASEDWALSSEPDGVALIAVRFGQGLGWSAENIVGDFDELRAWLKENEALCDDVEYIAVGFTEPAVVLVYHEGSGSPFCTVRAVQ
jgi:hypothetical protein